MARGYVTLLLLTAGIWGASFMFIKVGVEEIEPIPLMAARLLVAALVLVPFVVFRRGAREALGALRAGGRGMLLLGSLNSALPFVMIAWGEQHVNSSIAAIANSPVPIFVTLLALRFRPSERVTGLRLAGVVLGFVGVAVLVGFRPEGGWWAVAGTLAVVAAALCYAIANLYAQGRFADTPADVIATGATLTGGLMLLPPALFQLPESRPSAEALGSVAALAVLGTALALLFYYRMLTRYGASRASLVTYIIPPVAVVYGVAILDESVTASAVVGLVCILGGVALGSGVLPHARRRPAEIAPATPRS